MQNLEKMVRKFKVTDVVQMGEDAPRKKGRKLNKTKRGGGTKGLFFGSNTRDSQLADLWGC
jgi:hypothetical protein